MSDHTVDPAEAQARLTLARVRDYLLEREANITALISRYTNTDPEKAAVLEDKLDLVHDVFNIIDR